MNRRAALFVLASFFAVSCEEEGSAPPGPPPDKVAEAEAMVAKLDEALESFKADYGQYPWHGDPMYPISADVIRELMPEDPRIVRGLPPSINVNGTTYLHDIPSYYISDGTLVDPWGCEYYFVRSISPEMICILSFGPNAMDETSDGDADYGDDISNLP